MHPDDRPRIVAALEDCLAGRTPDYRTTYRVRHADGSYRWGMAHGVAERDGAGRVTHLSGSHIDVTELRLAERHASERARQALFVANVSAALADDTPLRSMLGRCAAAMAEFLPAAWVAIWTRVGPSGDLELQATLGLDAPPELAPTRVRAGHGIIGRVAADEQPYVSEDPASDDESALRDWFFRAGLRAFAVHPLILRGRLVGVTAVAAREGLSPASMDALAAIRHPLAIGIERKQLEIERERLAAILERATDFVTIGQPAGGPLYINKAARTALGIGPSEVVESLLEFRPAEFGEFFDNVMLPALAADGVWSGEATYISRDGRRLQVSQVSVAHRNPDGEVEFISTISRDISELHRASEAIREAEETAELALEAGRAGVWLADLRTGKIVWSGTKEPQSGLLPGQFLGSLDHFLSVVHPDDRQIIATAVQDHADHPGDFELEFRIQRPDGAVRWIQSHGRVQTDPEGQPVRVVGVARDITDRKELETQLRQSQKLEAIGQLAGGLAHDFNNLLTVIVGYSQQILDRLVADDPLRDDLEQVCRAGQRATQLTRQLLAFSRKQIMRPVPLDLNALISDTSRMLGPLIGEHIELVLRLDPRLDPLMADPGQIEQILVNLAVNARDAMTGGGVLTIATKPAVVDERFAREHGISAGRYVQLSVADTGVGMDAATLKRIFEPFFTTKPVGRGTGMGLSTVFGIAKQTGGCIEVESRPGQGATFTLFLPGADRLPTTLRDERRAQAGGATGETILVVDDESAVRRFVKQVLVARGYTVLSASTSEEALQRLQSSPTQVALVLTDLVLRGQVGTGLFAMLREGRPHLRVLYMSGFADDVVRAAGAFKPGSAFLPKPFSAQDLAAKVREALDAPVARGSGA
jgi:PAS domain S-box-containing protein